LHFIAAFEGSSKVKRYSYIMHANIYIYMYVYIFTDGFMSIACFAHIFGVSAEVHLHMRMMPLTGYWLVATEIQRYKDTYIARKIFVSGQPQIAFAIFRSCFKCYVAIEIPLGSSSAVCDPLQ